MDASSYPQPEQAHDQAARQPQDSDHTTRPGLLRATGDDSARAHRHPAMSCCRRRHPQIPREQISYRLAFYRDHLAAHGVHLAQSTRYRALFVPTLGSDTGGYFSHIWREP